MTEEKGTPLPSQEQGLQSTANNEMVLKDDKASAILTAAREYTKRGWVVHPLSKPDDKGNSPGKKPLLANWQKLTATPPDIETHIKRGCNLGLVCGKASGVTVIDFDSFLFVEDLLGELDLKQFNPLVSQRKEGRCHLFFKYNPDLKAQKHHDLGIEILNDGSNAVLPPSIHQSGDVYRWTTLDAVLIHVVRNL